MKNLIYQYWDGIVKKSAIAGANNMKNYADSIGVEHIFEINPQYAKSLGWKIPAKPAAHFGALKPVFDNKFDEYDNILYVDTDVFVKDGVTENIFNEFNGEIGICDEPEQPELRKLTLAKINSQTDEHWAKTIKKLYNIEVPRTKTGLVRCYNSGMVLWSKLGRQKARKEFTPFNVHVQQMKSNNNKGYYLNDQIYINTMIAVTSIKCQEMDNDWNSYMHGYADKVNSKRRILDWRTSNTKFVHCMFSGADNMTGDELWRYVNLPASELNYEL